MANDSTDATVSRDIVSGVIDELERTIPGAYRSGRGLELDGDAVMAAARGIDAGTSVERPDEDEEDAPDLARIAAARERRRRLLWDADPDIRFERPAYTLIDVVDGIGIPSPFAESRTLRLIGAALIERNPKRYGPLARLNICYLWARDLGNVAGEARLWRLRKGDDWTRWALADGRPVPRHVDLFVLLNSTVAALAELTNWQAQAAVHESLECVRVRRGKVAINPRTVSTQAWVIRRYGEWEPNLKAIGEALRAAEGEQLPLWEEEEGE